MTCLNFDGQGALDYGSIDAGVFTSFTPNGIEFFGGNENPDQYLSTVADDCGGFFLRKQYPPQPAGSAPSGQNDIPIELGQTYEELWLTYCARFGGDFDWTGPDNNTGNVGKLPGLAGGCHPSGFDPNRTCGFTARLGWDRDGFIGIYVTDQDTGATTWEASSHQIQRGQWMCIEEHVRLNTGDDANGLVELFVNGVLVGSVSNIRLRTAADQSWGIDVLYFSTFHGGGGLGYSPSTNSTVDYDDFQWATERMGCCPKLSTAGLTAIQTAIDTCGETVIGREALCKNKGQFQDFDFSFSGGISVDVQSSQLTITVTGPATLDMSSSGGCPCVPDYTFTGTADCGTDPDPDPDPPTGAGQLVI